jgi:hypothetical protein
MISIASVGALLSSFPTNFKPHYYTHILSNTWYAKLKKIENKISKLTGSNVGIQSKEIEFKYCASILFGITMLAQLDI